mmetsp:Transcript_33014/g.82224  ORF Transcript_33014/g.82224 Transcript_33014/m.82224 type:complete len:117 (-) Transcript_33014:290-640(-)
MAMAAAATATVEWEAWTQWTSSRCSMAAVACLMDLGAACRKATRGGHGTAASDPPPPRRIHRLAKAHVAYDGRSQHGGKADSCGSRAREACEPRRCIRGAMSESVWREVRLGHQLC